MFPPPHGAGSTRIIQLEEKRIGTFERRDGRNDAMAAVGPVSAGGQPGRLCFDGDGQAAGKAGRMAHFRKGAVSPRGAGRGAGRRAGNEGVPAQDPALVLPLRLPPAASGADFWAGLAGPVPPIKKGVCENGIRFYFPDGPEGKGRPGSGRPGKAGERPSAPQGGL